MKIFDITTRLTLLLFILTGLTAGPLELVSGRENVDESLRMYGSVTGSSSHFTTASRFFNAIIAVLLILLVINILRNRILLTPNAKRVVFGLTAYLVSNYVLGSLFGSDSGLPGIYFVLTVTTLIVLGSAKNLLPSTVVGVFRIIASFMVLGSLASGILFPDWSYMADASYEFRAGGTNRLIGFYAHPSVLGIHALMLLSIELRSGKKGFFHTANMAGAFAVLILSLSKTAIILAIIMYTWHLAKKGIWGIILIGLIAFISILFLIENSSTVSILSSNKNFSTLTGRTELWELIIDSWMKNPLFGNGPALFPIEQPANFAHAHNIVLQALSDGGLFGLLGLLFYVYALFRTAYENRRISNNLSLLLPVSLFLFSLAEPVMRMNSFLNGMFFINAFVVLYLCSIDRYRMNMLASQSPGISYSSYPRVRFT